MCICKNPRVPFSLLSAPFLLVSFFPLGKVRAIRRIPCTPPPATIMAYWEWDQGRQRFVPYDIQASVDIETAYSNGQGSIDLSTAPSRIPYTINMRSQYQTRHRYNTRREIRRVPLQQPLVTYLQPQPPSQPSPLPSSSSSPAATAMAANPQFFFSSLCNSVKNSNSINW